MLMYALIFGVIFYMFILPGINNNTCTNTSENMVGWFDHAVGAVSHAGSSAVGSVVVPPGRCSNNCCNAALQILPNYNLINDTVCQGRWCVCLTATEQDKLRIGVLKVTDLF